MLLMLHWVELSFLKGFIRGSDGKESACNARDPDSIPGSGRFPWRREWQPTPVSLPGESHGRRSLAGYSPQGRKESDTTEHSKHTDWSVLIWWPMQKEYLRWDYRAEGCSEHPSLEFKHPDLIKVQDREASSLLWRDFSAYSKLFPFYISPHNSLYLIYDTPPCWTGCLIHPCIPMVLIQGLFLTVTSWAGLVLGEGVWQRLLDILQCAGQPPPPQPHKCPVWPKCQQCQGWEIFPCS